MIDSIHGVPDINFLRNLQAENQTVHQHTPGQQGTGVEVDNHDNDQDVIDVQGNRDQVGNEREQVNATGATEEKESSSERVGNEPRSEGELTDEEKAEVQQLKQIDREVRAHELAHLAAAQGIALSGANFEFERGPDGVNYAVGGDVQIDTSEEETPEQTIAKAQKIISAAEAPSDPSGQDRQVAAQARAMQADAQAELAKERSETGATSLEQQNSIDTGTTRQSGSLEPASEGDSPRKVGGVFENRNENYQHPGIQTYQQNQDFAPSSPLNPEFETIGTTPNNFAALAQHRYAAPGLNLDLVA